MEKVIMYDANEAAVYKEATQKGWWSRENAQTKLHFWGEDEHMARYWGCSHVRCPCGEIIKKCYSRCIKCRDKIEKDKFKNLPLVEWDEETPLCIFNSDIYFFDYESIIDYCDESNRKIEDLSLVICEPQYAALIGEDYWEDSIAEDGDLPGELLRAIHNINLVIKKLKPLSWVAGEKRVKVC